MFEQKLNKIITPVLDDMGFRLVMVEFKRGVLSILAENTKTGRITLDECASISRELSPVLEVEDPIKGAYRLEVSSPGIDRPLVTSEDFKSYTGFEAKIELNIPKGTQKRFRGVIEKEENGIVYLQTDRDLEDLEIANIRKAKLVLTDALIEASRKKFEELQKEEVKG